MITCLLLLAPLQAQQPEADAVATRQYSVALGFQKKGIYDQAAERWTRFIQAHPKHPRIATAHHHLGVCQLQLGKCPEAAATFRLILTRFGDFKSLDSVRFNLGLALYNAAEAGTKPADYKQAAAAFVDMAAKHPKSPLVDRALYYQAECLCLANDLNAAVPVYQQAIKQFSNSPLLPRLYFALGATQQDLDKHAEAAGTMQTLLQKFPNDPLANDARLRLGLAHFQQQKFAEAEPLFAQAAAAKDYSNADLALMKYAQSLFEQNKLPQAVAQYESLPKRFATSPHVGAALLAAGKCRYRSEAFPAAQNHFSAVVNQKGAEAPEAAYWLGRTLVRLNKADEALTAVEQAIAAYPKSELLPLLQFGRIDAIAAIENRQAEAVNLFVQFAAQHAEHAQAPAALHRAALGAFQIGDLANAQKHSDAFLAHGKFARHDLIPEVLLIGGESYLRGETSDPAKAVALFRRLAGEFPQHRHAPRAQLGIGACLHAQQQFDPAIKHLTSLAGVLKDPALLAESQLLIGRSHLDAGRPQQAVPVLQAALKTKADWPYMDEVLLALAVSLRGAGQLDPAVAELNKLIAGHPKSDYRDQAFYQLGEVLFSQQKLDPAIAAYQKLVAETPQSSYLPTALYGIAAAQFEKADLASAAATLDKLLTAHAQAPAARQGYYLRGICRLRLQQYEPAAQDLTAYVALQPPPPDLTDARFGLARCQIGLKQPDAAIASMTALLKEAPDYPRADDVYYELAFAYLGQMKDKEAAEAFRTLVTRLPMSPRAGESWYRVGAFEEQGEKWKEAAAAFAAGLKVAETPALKEKLYYKLGLAQFKQQQFPAAVSTLQTQLKEAAKGDLRFAAMYLLGESLFRQDQYAPALPHLAGVIASQDEKAKEFHAPALYRSAICAANMKNWPLSEQHYGKLVSGFPRFEQIGEARYGLGVALQNQQKFDTARSAFKAVTDTEPDTETAAKSWFMMGQCWFAQKRYADAIDCFSEVAFGFKHEEWQPLSYFEAGRCYVQLEDTQSARKMLAAVVQDFPKHPRAKDAQTILDNLDK